MFISWISLTCAMFSLDNIHPYNFLQDLNMRRPNESLLLYIPVNQFLCLDLRPSESSTYFGYHPRASAISAEWIMSQKAYFDKDESLSRQ